MLVLADGYPCVYRLMRINLFFLHLLFAKRKEKLVFSALLRERFSFYSFIVATLTSTTERGVALRSCK